INSDYRNVDNLINKIINILNKINNYNERRLFEAIIKVRDKLFWGPYIDYAPHIMVIPKKGFTLMEGFAESYITEPTVAGDHITDNIYIMSIPDAEIRSYAKMIREPWDFANLVLSYLNIPLPHNADGNIARALGSRVGFKNYLSIYNIQRKIARTM
ncbi:MAG: hypothetical protein F7C81_04885, partial [Desulfurococcales archaeon]|nr:hypothetical protein [Desulfurococcales archaeon]